MKAPGAPGLDSRRAEEFAAELHERARAWVPSWALADGERDFGRALLKIAARFSSEVAERLDRSGEKMQRGFLDWLAVRGQAARAARVPVVFKLAGAARNAILASTPVRLQVDAGGASVIFETDSDVRLVPGNLQTVIGVDGAADGVYFPPPGLSDLEPLEPLPSAWQLKSFAAESSKTLQVDPETGLAPGLILEAAGQQYRIVGVDNEIVTVDPPLVSALPEQTILRKVTSFSPFDGKTRNRQRHALYLGHADLLDIDSAATISITGAQSLGDEVDWEYWGKGGTDEEVRWRPLVVDDEQPSGAIALHKPKGAVEKREIGGKSSRWIRAITSIIQPEVEPFEPSQLAIAVNADRCHEPMRCDEKTSQAPAAEGMANTTPLVLENTFLPLGREPRQFDAFYLGSAEAFSKKGAEVQLCFEMADPSFASLSLLRGAVAWGTVFGAIGGDRRLHLLQFRPATRQLEKFRDRGSVQPPLPGFNGQAAQTTPIVLDARPHWRIPMWNQGYGFLVGATAGADVWLWHEKLFDRQNSGWIFFDPVPGSAPSSQAPIDALVHLEGLPSRLAALREGKLSLRTLPPGGTPWTEVETKDASNAPVSLKSIVSVLADSGGELLSSTAAGMVGISDSGFLYGVSMSGDCTELTAPFVSPDLQPAAVMDGADLAVVAVEASNPPQLVAFHESRGTSTEILENDARVLGSIDVVLHGGQFHFVATVFAPDRAYLAVWTPFASNPQLFKTPIPAAAGEPGGAPTLFGRDVLVPGTRADLLLAEFDLSRRASANEVISSGIVLRATDPLLSATDIVARVEGVPEFRTVTAAGVTRNDEVFYQIDAPFGSGADGPLLAYRASTPHFSGTVTAPNQLDLDPNDSNATEGAWIFADGVLREILVLTAGSPPTATVAPDFSANDPGQYWEPLSTNGRTAPFLKLDPATSGNWDAALLDRVELSFPGADPEAQFAKAFEVDADNRPIIVVLAREFTVLPPGNPTFIADGTVGQWSRILGDTSSNPELSWEYWNGTGWWKLDLAIDQTLHLKNTGAVRFRVPDDMASGDWAGRTNHWIRARLVGGDYGKEQVTVTTKPTGNPGETQQAVERSSSGIRPPSVVRLHIAYRLCDGVLPDCVFAEDSGSMRDQSDANRTSGAIVEAFVPLALALGRLSAPAAPAESQTEECPPPCRCPSEAGNGGSDPNRAAGPAPAASAEPRETGRAIFIGLNAAPSGAPVNVLLLVDRESRHDRFSPMKIEALGPDGFFLIAAEDTTRALGESGLLSMAFPIRPTPRELFGMENLTWLRLTPGGGAPVNEWTPSLRGAYLNAVWASAAETLTRELLGSSEGAPNLRVRVARPPVLRDSLELRVREPLGDADRQALRRGDENRVRSEVDGLSGDWVLWNRVTDPLDELSDARVYALDEATGEIRFGDGQHGMIPPIGRDSIVAFTYRRAEVGDSQGDVPGNAVEPRAALNLVSSVESVEGVFAADRAAGGAPPESGERIVRFGTARLRHRNRAITAHDLEDLALESSPEIVQARCFVSRGTVRLVVVMRGENPVPDAAQVRELRRLLLEASPAGLSAPDAFRITGPRIRRLRVILKLRVASIGDAGEVTRAVHERIIKLFDTATGGGDGTGWALGAEPAEEEIAWALLSMRRLEGIAEVRLREVPSDGVERPWAGALKANDLVVLDHDPVRVELELVEVIA